MWMNSVPAVVVGNAQHSAVAGFVCRTWCQVYFLSVLSVAVDNCIAGHSDAAENLRVSLPVLVDLWLPAIPPVLLARQTSPVKIQSAGHAHE